MCDFQAGTAGAMTAPAGESDEDAEGLGGPGKQVAWDMACGGVWGRLQS